MIIDLISIIRICGLTCFENKEIKILWCNNCFDYKGRVELMISNKCRIAILDSVFITNYNKVDRGDFL